MEYSRQSHGGRKGASMGNIIGDPFALATTSIGALAWIIAFISCVIGQIQSTKLDGFPTFSWWSVVFMLFLIIGVMVVVAADAAQTYHIALVGYLACGLVLTSSSVNALVYSSSAAREAAAAGFILLSMVNIVWIFYFGSAPSATPRAYLDSFALTKEAPMNRQTMNTNNYNGYNGHSGRPETSVSNAPPQMYTSAQLSGLENPSPVAGFSANAAPRSPAADQLGQGNLQGGGDNKNGNVEAPFDYPYRAKAIYSYEANPDDTNEISFSKHEIIEVSDVSGRWWQARKDTGQIGIAPSNYLILL